MPTVSLADWNHFLFQHTNAHLLQTGEWGELKSAFGWKPVRVVDGDFGVQMLFRKLPLGFTIGYIPKAVNREQLPVTNYGKRLILFAESIGLFSVNWSQTLGINNSSFRIHHSVFQNITSSRLAPSSLIFVEVMMKSWRR